MKAGQLHYVSMEIIGRATLVPLSLAALLSGLTPSLGTEWGLFRHYWIVAKLSLTVPATAVLLLHIPSVSRMARLAMDTALATGDYARASHAAPSPRSGRPAGTAHNHCGLRAQALG